MRWLTSLPESSWKLCTLTSLASCIKREPLGAKEDRRCGLGSVEEDTKEGDGNEWTRWLTVPAPVPVLSFINCAGSGPPAGAQHHEYMNKKQMCC